MVGFYIFSKPNWLFIQHMCDDEASLEPQAQRIMVNSSYPKKECRSNTSKLSTLHLLAKTLVR